METSLHLIDQFVLGLATPSVKEYTWEQRPRTYAAALHAAQNKAAAVAVLTSTTLGAPVPGQKVKLEPGISAMQPTTGEPDHSKLKCFHCNQLGHIKRRCEAWLKLQKTTTGKSSSNGAPRNNGRFTKPAAATSSGHIVPNGKGKWKKAINSVEGPTDSDLWEQEVAQYRAELADFQAKHGDQGN